MEQGESIPRKSVWFILQGIIYSGHWFGKDPENDSSQRLARVFKENIATLCRDAQLELSEHEHRMLEEWITEETERLEALRSDGFYEQISSEVADITEYPSERSAASSGGLSAKANQESSMSAFSEEESH
jgi:hypothetical protein